MPASLRGTMTVDLPEIARYLRVGRTQLSGALAERVAHLRDETLATLRPAHVWRRFPVQGGVIESGAHRMPIDGTLARHIAGCRAVYLACGTIGPAFDAFHRRISVKSGADAFIVQAIGAALVEKLMDSVEYGICAELEEGEAIVPRYSPGYGDFPLAAQREMLALLDAPRKVGVSLTDTLLMVPSKSVTAVIGVKGMRATVRTEPR